MNAFARKITNYFLNPVSFLLWYGAFLALFELQLRFSVFFHGVFVVWAYSILAIKAFRERKFPKHVGWMTQIIFVALIGITAIVNYPNAFVEQIKIIILTIIPFFLIYPVFKDCKEDRVSLQSAFLRATRGFNIVVMLCAFAALISFLFKFSFVDRGPAKLYLGVQLDPYVEGAQTLLLYGVYKDTNVAAMLAAASLCISAINLIAYRKIPAKYKFLVPLHWINIVLQALFISLSTSRGIYLSLAFGSAIILPWVYEGLLKDKFRICWKRWSVGVLLTVLTITLTASAVVLVQKASISYLQNIPCVTSEIKPQMKESNGKDVDVPESENSDPVVLCDLPIPEFLKGTAGNQATSGVDVTFDKSDTGSWSGNSRLKIWSEGFVLFKNHMIFGIGHGNEAHYAATELPGSKYMKINKALHNSYLEVLYNYGVAGFLVYLIFGLQVLVVYIRSLGPNRVDTEEKIILMNGLILLIALMFVSAALLGSSIVFMLLMLEFSYLLARARNR